MQTFLEANFDLFHGDATARLARIYARLPNIPEATLVGHLRGPQSLLGTTLPATLPFRDLGPGSTMLAEAVLPDPCFWSPEMPALYTAHLEVRRGGEVLASLERTLGVKAFGAKGHFFYDQGKRTVLRGVHYRQALTEDLLAWHDQACTLMAVNPSDPLCDEASRVGVRIIARLQQATHDLPSEIRRLGRHAAVHVIAINQHQAQPATLIDQELQRLAPTVVLARESDSDSAPLPGDLPEARLIPISAAPSAVEQLRCFSEPVLIWNPGSNVTELPTARADCDHLQALCAPYGDFAGYLV